MAETPRTLPRATLSERLRCEIEAATASGTALDELVLRLTLLDASKLKRDPQVALDDIWFGSEGIHYLGVRVKEGGVRSSVLEAIDPSIGQLAAELEERPPARKKPRTKRPAVAPAAHM